MVKAVLESLYEKDWYWLVLGIRSKPPYLNRQFTFGSRQKLAFLDPPKFRFNIQTPTHFGTPRYQRITHSFLLCCSPPGFHWSVASVIQPPSPNFIPKRWVGHVCNHLKGAQNFTHHPKKGHVHSQKEARPQGFSVSNCPIFSRQWSPLPTKKAFTMGVATPHLRKCKP